MCLSVLWVGTCTLRASSHFHSRSLSRDREEGPESRESPSAHTAPACTQAVLDPEISASSILWESLAPLSTVLIPFCYTGGEAQDGRGTGVTSAATPAGAGRAIIWLPHSNPEPPCTPARATALSAFLPLSPDPCRPFLLYFSALTSAFLPNWLW